MMSPRGHGGLTYEDAKMTCRAHDARLASISQLHTAVLLGFENCQCGWVQGARVFYAFQYGWSGCGNSQHGPNVVDCLNAPRSISSVKMYDAYCFDSSEDGTYEQ